MPKSLRPHRAPGPQLRAACLGNMARARDALRGGASDAAAHAARRACKRARACLRLLRPGLTDAAFDAVDGELRAAGRALGPIRDAAVLTLTATSHGVTAPPATPPHGRDRVAAQREALGALDRAVAALPARTGLSARQMGRAAGRVYRQARARYRAARADPAPEAFHALRRSVKHHAHHIRLLRGVWPDCFAAWHARLDALGDGLGREHDLTVLEAALAAHNGRLAAVRRIQDARDSLRAEILAEGAVLFAERPRALGRRLSAYWRAYAGASRVARATRADPAR